MRRDERLDDNESQRRRRRLRRLGPRLALLTALRSIYTVPLHCFLCGNHDYLYQISDLAEDRFRATCRLYPAATNYRPSHWLCHFPWKAEEDIHGPQTATIQAFP